MVLIGNKMEYERHQLGIRCTIITLEASFTAVNEDSVNDNRKITRTLPVSSHFIVNFPHDGLAQKYLPKLYSSQLITSYSTAFLHFDV